MNKEVVLCPYCADMPVIEFDRTIHPVNIKDPKRYGAYRLICRHCYALSTQWFSLPERAIRAWNKGERFSLLS